MSALPEGPHEAKVEELTLSVEGTPVRCLHARPVGTALAGLVVAPDLAGLRPLYEDICRRLASHGFAVCAVEYFSRLESAAGTHLDLDARLARAPQLYDEVILEDLAEAADHLAAVDHVHGASVLGFCNGGAYALKAAATGRFERSVAFYGMVRTPPQWRGGGQHDALDGLASACPTLAIFGDADTWVPPEDVEAVRAAFAGRPDHRVVVYRGAEHGFAHDPDRPAHRVADAADAWHRALAFLLE
ncbi:MAG: dienelactone hydrolase family protein [Acidimicrobiia bacterium]